MILDAAGNMQHMQKMKLTTASDSLYLTHHNIIFQNLVHSGSATLTNYRIFMGYMDTSTIAAKKLHLQSRSTTVLQLNIDDAGTPQYAYGTTALSFVQNALYFGGAREYSTGFVPLIGYANPSTLVATNVWYLDDLSLHWIVDIIYPS